LGNNVIRIHRRLDSETLHLPELKPLLGKTVEIIVVEERSGGAAERNWQALIDAAGEDLIDPEVYKQYREFDRGHNKPPEL
jgi:hypothetical protein